MRHIVNEPVRNILPSSYSIRGQINSPKNSRALQYESALERNLLQLLEFDKRVECYCEQLVTIEYVHECRIRHYTPDVLIYYREDLAETQAMRPQLYEVKYRADLKQNWAEHKPC